MHNLIIDLETYSSTDISKSGVYRYAEDKDFEILLFGYSIDFNEAKVIDLANGEKIPEEIVEAILNHDSVLGNKIITEHINKVIGDIEELKTIYPDYFE